MVLSSLTVYLSIYLSIYSHLHLSFISTPSSCPFLSLPWPSWSPLRGSYRSVPSKQRPSPGLSCRQASWLLSGIRSYQISTQACIVSINHSEHEHHRQTVILACCPTACGEQWTHLLTHLVTHSLYRSLTHSLTHYITHYITHQCVGPVASGIPSLRS